MFFIVNRGQLNIFNYTGFSLGQVIENKNVNLIQYFLRYLTILRFKQHLIICMNVSN